MPDSTFQPDAVQAIEATPQLSPVYCYAIRSEDASDAVFLTSWNRAVSITGLPARFNGADPQVFTPTQISHGPIDRRAEFDRHSFEVTARFDTANLSAHFITTPTTPMTVEIIRIAKGAVGTGDAAAAWGTDTYVVQGGLIQEVTLRGDLVTVSCVPRPFHMESGVPRLWFNRECQWALYGQGCGLNKATFAWESQITAIDRKNRKLTIDGAPAGEPDNYFFAGFMVHNDTEAKFTCLSATKTAGDTVVTLGHWSDALEIGDQVVLYPGCRRTVSDCTSKFNNAVNFGGFSKIPDRNPSINGV